MLFSCLYTRLDLQPLLINVQEMYIWQLETSLNITKYNLNTLVILVLQEKRLKYKGYTARANAP